MVQLRDDVVGLDAAIIMNPRVWEVSGHVAGFSDPMVDCRNCKLRFRADDLKGPPSEIACPNCGNRGTLTEARQFNLMFQTHVGPLEESASVAYLRPETAQGIFVNFANVATTMRRKLPFGIAQIGKSFRNEITPGNFIFRDREFEQMEMEFFVHPSQEDEWFAYWVAERLRWWTDVDGDRRRPAPAPAARAGRAVALQPPDDRHRVRLPDGLVRARGGRRPHRLRPDRRTPRRRASRSPSSTRRAASTSRRT